MSEKRFFILKDDEYDDVLPCIRDRWRELKDIYGHYKYDDINQICDLLNALHEENIRLKRDFDSCSHNWSIMYDEAKEKVEKLTEENLELEQENERLENKLWNCQNVR